MRKARCGSWTVCSGGGGGIACVGTMECGSLNKWSWTLFFYNMRGNTHAVLNALQNSSVSFLDKIKIYWMKFKTESWSCFMFFISTFACIRKKIRWLKDALTLILISFFVHLSMTKTILFDPPAAKLIGFSKLNFLSTVHPDV